MILGAVSEVLSTEAYAYPFHPRCNVEENFAALKVIGLAVGVFGGATYALDGVLDIAFGTIPIKEKGILKLVVGSSVCCCCFASLLMTPSPAVYK